MKYKILDLDKRKHQFIGGGAFGEYYRINARLGVKVLKFFGLSDHDIFSKKWAISKLTWAQKEAKNLQKAKNSRITPNFKGYCIVKLDNKYRPAILMQHLECYLIAKDFLNFDAEQGKHYDWKTIPFKHHVKFSKKLKMDKVVDSGSLYEHVNSILKKRAKIEHKDLHYNNVMFKLLGNQVTSVKVVDLESAVVVDKGS